MQRQTRSNATHPHTPTGEALHPSIRRQTLSNDTPSPTRHRHSPIDGPPTLAASPTPDSSHSPTNARPTRSTPQKAAEPPSQPRSFIHRTSANQATSTGEMPASAQPPQPSFSECSQAYCCSYRHDLTAANLPRRHNTNRRHRKSRTGIDPSGSLWVVDRLRLGGTGSLSPTTCARSHSSEPSPTCHSRS